METADVRVIHGTAAEIMRRIVDNYTDYDFLRCVFNDVPYRGELTPMVEISGPNGTSKLFTVYKYRKAYLGGEIDLDCQATLVY